MSESTTERITVRVIYTGRHEKGDGKIGYGYLLEADRTTRLLYLKVGHAGMAVGGIYELQSTDDVGSSVYGQPSFTGDRVDDETQRAIWQAQDQAVARRQARAKAERALKRRSDLDELLEPLEEVARGLRSRADVHALSGLISERLTEAWYRR